MRVPITFTYPIVQKILTVTLLLAASKSSLAVVAPIVNRYGQSGLFYSHSAKTLGMGRLVVSAYGMGSFDRTYLYAFDGDTAPSSLMAINFLPALGYGITNYLDFSLALPVYWDQCTKIGGLRGGFGDLEVTGKFQYPPYPHEQVFEVAFLGALSMPTGSSSEGFFPRHSYYFERVDDENVDTGKVRAFYTSKTVEMDMKMLWTLDIEQLNKTSPILLHVNFGARFVFDPNLENIFLLNLAFEYRPRRWLNLFTEFSGETRMDNVKRGFKLGEDPLRLSPGVSFTPPGGFYLTLGGDIGLCADTTLQSFLVQSHGKQRLAVTRIDQRWRIGGTIGWAGFVMPQDQDHDGIKDNVDRCPKDPEDYDGFEDSDGCPEPDNDNDGIADIKDKCQNDPEDRDGFRDDDGCPEPDNDKDGLLDIKDQCPNVAEDLDGFQDDDGCPDFDNDNDGVPDSLDKCLNVAEDRDGFMDNDGCPDFDNDNDGVPDSVDKCRDTPGSAENNGCPLEKPKPKEIKRGRVVLRGVNFEFGSAVLTRESYTILEEVYESLYEWPEVRVEIRGHTDAIGSNEANRILSQKRAEAVMNYFIGRGIDPSRLRAVGFGEEDPIADNKTAEGRALNRRVELHRID